MPILNLEFLHDPEDKQLGDAITIFLKVKRL